LYTGGQHQEAASVFEQARQAVPTDPEVTAWAQRASLAAETVKPSVSGAPATASPDTRPAVEAESAPAHSADDNDACDAKAVCEDLFDPKRMSFEVNQRFEEKYLDRPVRWSGRLRSINSYTFDLVFGDGKGTKAVFEVHEVPGVYGGKMVQAVVQLPPEASDDLGVRTGETLTFSGRLVRCDAFMRNLFVADGKLVET
jgi:hypothetical protein